MSRPVAMTWVVWVLRVLPLVLGLGGCFLLNSPRPDPNAPIAGPPPYVENCQACHATPVAAHYAMSLHTAMGIKCGQCHTPGGHPNFAQPIRDGKCGGCHQPQYQETLTSKHFATREAMALDDNRDARKTLRREGFTVPVTGGRRFVGDPASGQLGGRLCAACHYDEHRLDLAAVQRENFCTGCHTDRENHFAIPTPDFTNRCVPCHVRVGQTVTGQIVNTHRFARPGAAAGGE